MEHSVENRDATWNVIGIQVHGTITWPTDGHNGTAIVFVAGSGPTDRNWCSPLLPGSNGSAGLLAETLARRGYVTMRYDKMASGPHVMDNLPKFSGKISMQTHLEELAGAVGAVTSTEGIDIRNMFALTNSEGAIHAVNYQLACPKADRFNGLILTGAPGRSVGDIGRSQLVAMGKSLPDAESIIARYDEAIAEFVAGRQTPQDPSLPDVVRLVLRSLETPANLPFARELWSYSLPEHLKSVEEPMLVMIGKKDLQIDWKVDGGAIENAMSGKSQVSFAYPENANHVLKHEDLPYDQLTAQYVSGRYNSPDSKLDEVAENEIIEWLNRER